MREFGSAEIPAIKQFETHTTATGSALVAGIAGTVFEQQRVTLICSGCLPTDSLTLRVGANGVNVSFSSQATAASLEAALLGAAFGDGAGRSGILSALHVTRTDTTPGGHVWSITFSSPSGDMPLAVLFTGGVTSGSVLSAGVEEYVRGRANAFSIEPKDASGAIVRDFIDEGPGNSALAGADVFFTELWTSDESARGGLAGTQVRRGVYTGVCVCTGLCV